MTTVVPRAHGPARGTTTREAFLAAVLDERYPPDAVAADRWQLRATATARLAQVAAGRAPATPTAQWPGDTDLVCAARRRVLRCLPADETPGSNETGCRAS